jgi:hypothetical protein
MDTAQRRALKKYRARLSQRGLTRFEITASETDRTLLRALARRLAEDGPDVEHIRATLKSAVVEDAPKTGGILAALRRSPLVGAEVEFGRVKDEGRHGITRATSVAP